jgi:hypothetical protein
MQESFLILKHLGLFVLFIGFVLMRNSQTDNEDAVSAAVIIAGFTLAIFSQIQQYVIEDKAKLR